MTKLEKIKEAYGDKYNRYVSDTDGWAPWPLMDISPLPDSYQTKNIGNTTFIRPKSIAGIEYNNGWTNIESEDDLPNEPGEYKVIDTDGFNFKKYAFYNDQQGKDYWIKFITHWKPIVKDLPPIY